MNKYLFIFLFYLDIMESQSFKYFNINPLELSGDNGQSQYHVIESDSHKIYVLGDAYKIIGNKDIHPILGLISYEGMVESSKLLIHNKYSSQPYDNNQIIKKSHGIYWVMTNIINPRTNYLSHELNEVNLLTGEVIKVKELVNHDTVLFSYSQNNMEYKDSILRFALTLYKDKRNYSEYIYELNTNLEIVKLIKINFNKVENSTLSWFSKLTSGNYEVIREVITDKDNKRSRNLEYIVLDSMGIEIRSKSIPELVNFSFVFGDVNTINKNEDGSFVFACRKMNSDSSLLYGIPYVVKVAPEFKEISWIQRFQDVISRDVNPVYSIYYLTKMRDNSGFIVSGDISNNLVVDPDYGYIFKVSNQGDSLWARRIQPLNWDSTRAIWMSLDMINITPYNTILVCGRVSDNLTNAIRGWILHLDSDGCLIPGCNIPNISVDIKSGKQKAIEIYPNPIQDKLYLLSRINTNGYARMTLLNLQGEIVLHNKILLNEGVQYIVDIPQSLSSGTYVINIIDENGKELLNEKIVKE